MTVKGTFMRVTGDLSVDADALERSSIRAIIDATSLETALPAFASVLRSRDFLGAEDHPTIEFRSQRITRIDDRFRIDGELVFRGEPRAVTIDAPAPEMQPTRLRVRGSAKVRGLVADEELELAIVIEAVPAAVAARWETHESRAPMGPASRPERADAGAPPRFVALVGSSRTGSLNQALLRAVLAAAPHGVRIEPFDLRDVPFYDGDLEAAGDPPAVRALKQAIASADGLIVITPEYNRGLPARIKNAIDWASRPPFGSPLADKPVALLGASSGRSGAANALADARRSLEYSHANVLEETVTVPRAQVLIDGEGRLTDPETDAAIASALRRLAAATTPAARRAA